MFVSYSSCFKERFDLLDGNEIFFHYNAKSQSNKWLSLNFFLSLRNQYINAMHNFKRFYIFFYYLFFQLDLKMSIIKLSNRKGNIELSKILYFFDLKWNSILQRRNIWDIGYMSKRFQKTQSQSKEERSNASMNFYLLNIQKFLISMKSLLMILLNIRNFWRRRNSVGEEKVQKR